MNERDAGAQAELARLRESARGEKFLYSFKSQGDDDSDAARGRAGV